MKHVKIFEDFLNESTNLNHILIKKSDDSEVNDYITKNGLSISSTASSGAEGYYRYSKSMNDEGGKDWNKFMSWVISRFGKNYLRFS